MTSCFDPDVWAGTKWRCGITGEEITLPYDVKPKQFFSFGDSFIDVGDGYYSRAGGQPIFIEGLKDCFCDRNNIGVPGVSCGDCPERDYKTR